MDDRPGVMFVSELKKEAARLDREAFCRRFEHPFLVMTGKAFDDEDDDLDFHTSVGLTVDPRDIPDIIAGRKLDPNAPVFRVAKNSAISPFSGFVSIGRTGNCDIVLPTSKISKFHAYISVKPRSDGGVGYFVADGESANGTKLNGKKLEPRSARDLADGDAIELGGVVTLRFFRSEGIWKILQ